jgi:MATE family multidrug resistance protein
MLVDENFKQRLRRLFSVMIPILITQTAIMAMNFFDFPFGPCGSVVLAGTSIGGNFWCPIFVALTAFYWVPCDRRHLIGCGKRGTSVKLSGIRFSALAFSVSLF